MKRDEYEWVAFKDDWPRMIKNLNRILGFSLNKESNSSSYHSHFSEM